MYPADSGADCIKKKADAIKYLNFIPLFLVLNKIFYADNLAKSDKQKTGLQKKHSLSMDYKYAVIFMNVL